jgi:FMN phosphatase YigB (HAD superfamily)
VDALLRGMGVRPLFGVTAGPDLVGVMKYRPGFYAPIFALAGVSPGDAVVVDDHPDALADAAAIGAATVYVPRAGAPVPAGFDAVVDSIRELPAALSALESARA